MNIPYSNPENVPASKLPEGWRFMLEEEKCGNREPTKEIKCWDEDGWAVGYTFTGSVPYYTYCVPWPLPPKYRQPDKDGWIEHVPGEPCPVDGNAMVQVKTSELASFGYLAANLWDWEMPAEYPRTPIIAYRLASKPFIEQWMEHQKKTLAWTWRTSDGLTTVLATDEQMERMIKHPGKTARQEAICNAARFDEDALKTAKEMIEQIDQKTIERRGMGKFLRACRSISMQNPLFKEEPFGAPPPIMMLIFGKNEVGEINPDGYFEDRTGELHEIKNIVCIVP